MPPYPVASDPLLPVPPTLFRDAAPSPRSSVPISDKRCKAGQSYENGQALFEGLESHFGRRCAGITGSVVTSSAAL